jgi:radical SAM protein with 4Fe4S-binding SPASM domain
MVKKITAYLKKHPHISPSLSRFPIPATFWRAGIPRILFRLSNFYMNCYQMITGKSKIIGYPTHMTVDVTNICNLRCPLCPTGVGAPGRKKGSMSFALFKKIIDETGNYLISIDLFNWGEPLLNKEIYKMIAYAHKKKIVTSISTNFHFLSEKLAEQLILSGLDILVLSIDGASQESFEKYRVGGDFAKVMDNIAVLVRKKKELRRNNPYICWQYLVMKHNEHEIEIARQKADQIGIDSITVDHAYLPVATREEALKWLPDDPKYHRYNLEELERVWERMEPVSDKKLQNSNEQDNHQEYSRRANCTWLWTQTTINWDGGVSPCCAIYDPAEDFGNINNTSFRKIWNSDRYKSSRLFSSTGTIEEIKTICMKCPLAMHD